MAKKLMTEPTFFERLQQNSRPVVVDFWAPWCGPCHMIDPILKKVGQEYDGRVDVWKVNADEQPDLLRQLRIYGIPTLIGFNAGQEVARQTGVASPQVLSALFESALSGEKSALSAAAARSGPAPLDRLLRIILALALLFMAYNGGFQGFYLFAALLSGLVFFSAVHDRCPIWQAIAPRLKKMLKIE